MRTGLSAASSPVTRLDAREVSGHPAGSIAGATPIQGYLLQSACPTGRPPSDKRRSVARRVQQPSVFPSDAPPTICARGRAAPLRAWPTPHRAAGNEQPELCPHTRSRLQHARGDHHPNGQTEPLAPPLALLYSERNSFRHLDQSSGPRPLSRSILANFRRQRESSRRMLKAFNPSISATSWWLYPST